MAMSAKIDQLVRDRERRRMLQLSCNRKNVVMKCVFIKYVFAP